MNNPSTGRGCRCSAWGGRGTQPERCDTEPRSRGPPENSSLPVLGMAWPCSAWARLGHHNHIQLKDASLFPLLVWFWFFGLCFVLVFWFFERQPLLYTCLYAPLSFPSLSLFLLFSFLRLGLTNVVLVGLEFTEVCLLPRPPALGLKVCATTSGCLVFSTLAGLSAFCLF